MSKKQPEHAEFDQQHLLAATGTDSAVPAAVAKDLRRIAAERLAAHRQRRNLLHSPEETTPNSDLPAPPNNPIAAAVFERYSHSPSYRAVLAEQAQRVLQQATNDAEAAVAEAEVAARNAQAVAAAQKRLLAELQLWNAPQTFSAQTAQTFQAPERLAPEPAPIAPVAKGTSDPWDWSADSLPTKIAADSPQAPAAEPLAEQLNGPLGRPEPLISLSELEELEAEIAFRKAPVFEPYSVKPEPIAANLVEFPRQIVAPRKARPRLAESLSGEFQTSFHGPLTDEPQLRIFEAEAESAQETLVPQGSAAVAAAMPALTPAWADLQLDSVRSNPVVDDEVVIRESVRAASYGEVFGEQPTIQAAPFALRVMATSVDLIVFAFSLLIALSVTGRMLHQLPKGWPAMLALALSVAILGPLYLVLFFTFSDQTPGMRFARIGFCGFNDEAPSRAAIRRRIVTQLIAAAPLGLGIFSALIDLQNLGWHDRKSQMYPRAY